jgi:hypothetical protein
MTDAALAPTEATDEALEAHERCESIGIERDGNGPYLFCYDHQRRVQPAPATDKSKFYTNVTLDDWVKTENTKE